MTEAARPRLLYVDDEEPNLVVFRRRFGAQFDVATASSAEEGLELLEKEQFTVVLCDQRMPRISGVELLRQAIQRQPDAVTVIVSAYTNFDDAMRAINEGQVVRYVRKPWQHDEMLEAILDAIALFERRRENRLLTESLIREQETGALRQLTSGLIHELANIAAVLGTIEDIRDDWGTDLDLSREISAVKKGVEKYWLLVESLRLCGRGHEELRLEISRHELGTIVREAVELARTFPQVKALHRLEVEADQPCSVEVDAPALSHVLINLLKNAAEACWGRARAEIKVKVRDGSDSISIDVEDTGPGVPEEIGERIFGGFYSSKGAAGTGLGLALSRRIVEAHGGRLDHHNGDQGCTFTVTLPAPHP